MAKEKREAVFPLVEAFGFSVESKSAGAVSAKNNKTCPFAENKCEKYRQYKFGYCSVLYSARDDEQKRFKYAVCDHRLDGPPLRKVLLDHFGQTVTPELVPEIKLHELRTSIDYVAFQRDSAGQISNPIAIETQAIDLRGGGVGPAWKAWEDGNTANWREYFSREANEKGRKDTVAYGVNMANITKRLGLQITVKGAYLKSMQIPLYVVMQDRPFAYLHRRIPFRTVAETEPADIIFVTFDYDETIDTNGSLSFSHKRTLKTTLALFSDALSKENGNAEEQRTQFIDTIEKKARTTNTSKQK